MSSSSGLIELLMPPSLLARRIFFGMNYSKVYMCLILNRQAQPLSENEYGEHHHIIPRSEGGSDDTSNLVRLSAREHYIAHLLLAKIYDDVKMYSAVTFMQTGRHKSRNFKFNSRLYEKIRKEFANKLSLHKKGKPTWNKGKKMSKEYCLKSSLAHKGIKLNQSSYDKMAASMSKLIWITNGRKSRRIKPDESIPVGWHKGRDNKMKANLSKSTIGRQANNKGKKLSAETKRKISESVKTAMRKPEVRRKFLNAMKKRKARR